jgi:hypothetical protein
MQDRQEVAVDPSDAVQEGVIVQIAPATAATKAK